ncbi:MAG: MBL fold metallo-hydrolase [Thermoleophilia bacterium]|nr:MBL fold metallo-hydrolase [Thermoleophilia bacterium]
MPDPPKSAAPVTRVTDHVYAVDAGALNVFLIVLPEGLTLIEAGFPGTMDIVTEVVRYLGRRPEDITDVLVTHCHPDHAAGLAEIEKATGARAWMHPADAEMVRAGRGFRPYTVTPGLDNAAFTEEVIAKTPPTMEPAMVCQDVASGATIPVAGGIQAVGTPGHTLGHLAFLWPEDGGVLFVGDAANNVGGLQLSPIHEDLIVGRASLRALAQLDFETACFAHGAPMVGGADQEFRRMWGGE